jgi:hypothetical protein
VSTTEAPKVLRKDIYFHETGYDPHLAQEVVHYTPSRHKALSNGRRWGKTLLGGKEAEVCAFLRNFLGEPMRGWIIGPQYSDCEKEFRVVYDSLRALGVDQVSSKFLRNVENGNMHIATNWGFDLQAKSAAHPETLVGEGLDFVLLVEAGRLKRSQFTQYVRPALSDKRGWSLMTGVPEIATDVSLLYWGYTRGQDSERKPWRSWKMPSWTNTIVFPGGRTDDEILEAEEDLTEDEFRRQYGGEFVEKIGRVIQEWDDDVHWKTVKYNPKLPLYAAVDYGYTNPFVWLWIQVDEFDNVYVIEEFYQTLKDTDDICKDYLKNHPLIDKLVAFYPDPAEPDDTATIVKNIRKPARSNTGGELKTRLALIRTHMKWRYPHLEPDHPDQAARLLVDRSCTKLAWEIREGYRWPEHKAEANRSDSELPIDKDNHGPEALGRFFKGYFDVKSEGKGRTRQSRANMRR